MRPGVHGRDHLEGWAYLATVIDLASRRVVRRALADHRRAELVCDALRMALPTAGAAQLIFHSDLDKSAHPDGPAAMAG